MKLLLKLVQNCRLIGLWSYRNPSYFFYFFQGTQTNCSFLLDLSGYKEKMVFFDDFHA